VTEPKPDWTGRVEISVVEPEVVVVFPRPGGTRTYFVSMDPPHHTEGTLAGRDRLVAVALLREALARLEDPL